MSNVTVKMDFIFEYQRGVLEINIVFILAKTL